VTTASKAIKSGPTRRSHGTTVFCYSTMSRSTTAAIGTALALGTVVGGGGGVAVLVIKVLGIHVKSGRI
jgi:hypothetical protein